MEKEKQKNLKVISKVIYVLARIVKILIVVALILLFCTMCIIPTLFNNIKVTDNIIKVGDKTYEYKFESNELTLIDENGQENNYSINTNFNIEKYLENNGTNEYILHSELFIISEILLIIIFYIVIDALEKLFRNIHNDNPFTVENTGYLRKMGKYLIITIVLNIILQLVFSAITNTTVTLSFESADIITILVLYSASYIFEYGCKLQEKTKEKIYS